MSYSSNGGELPPSEGRMPKDDKNSGLCDGLRPTAAYSRTAMVRWPMKNPSGPLQFWRLSRRLELQRTHGRLLIDGNSYWK